MKKTFIKIFSSPKNIVLAVSVFLTVLLVALLIPNVSLIGSFLKLPGTGIKEVLVLVVNLLGSLGTNFTTVTASYTVVIAIIFGINIALMVHYIKKFKESKKQGGAASSTLGIIVGAFGIGCASCGSLLVTTALSLFGISGSLTFLPFGGQEFGFIGVLLLGYSTYLLLKKITNPLVCKI